MPAFDLVIRGGSVIDGTGAPSRRADIAVVGGRIEEVGTVAGHGDEEFDAQGLIITPGFIDGHTHFDAQLFWDPLASPSSAHGVTTVVTGNCGFTLAPVRSGEEPLLVRNFERAEDMNGEVLAAALHWGWRSFPDFLDVVDRLPKAVNVASYIGHSAIRTFVMGERAFEEEATDDELAQMAAITREALQAGAIGFSTSRSLHETSDDRPVASRVASWEEMCGLVDVLRQEQTGVFEISNDMVASSSDSYARDEYRSRLQRLAVQSRVPVTFGLQPAWRGLELLETADRAALDGGRIFGQSHSRGVATLWTFEFETPFDRLPVWADVRRLGRADQIKAFAQPEVREALHRAVEDGDFGRAIGVEFRRPDPESVLVMESPQPPYRTVAQVARDRGCNPLDAVLDLAIETELHQFFIDPITKDSDEELVACMRHPRSVMTFSDAGAHAGHITDCSIFTYLFSYWVRERGVFSLEEAVHMVTQVPAQAWGLRGRGRIGVGYKADLNVIDAGAIGPGMPEVAMDLPGGHGRLTQPARGLTATFVGGRRVIDNGIPTGQCPGELVRGPFRPTVIPAQA